MVRFAFRRPWLAINSIICRKGRPEDECRGEVWGEIGQRCEEDLVHITNIRLKCNGPQTQHLYPEVPRSFNQISSLQKDSRFHPLTNAIASRALDFDQDLKRVPKIIKCKFY